MVPLLLVLPLAAGVPSLVLGEGAGSPEAPPGVATSGGDAADEERELRREQMTAARGALRRPPVGDAAFALAIVCNEQGDVTSAIRYWEEGLQRPRESVRLLDRAEMLAELGEALKVQGQFERAEQALREAVRLRPRRESTGLRLAQLLYDRDRAAECLAVLDAGPAKSAAAYGLRGQACQRLGRIAEARQDFERAQALDPNLAEACYGLSVVCARLGDAAGAARNRERFTELKAAQQTFGREFRASLNPLRTSRQSLAMTHTTVGWVWQDRGRPGRGGGTWVRAAGVDPANTACRFHLLMLYQQSGRNDSALRVSGEMIRPEPQNPFHQLSLGNLEARRGRLSEAGAAFEAAYRLAPDRAETCFALSQFFLRTDTNLPRAARLAAQAVELSPAAPHQYILSRAAAQTGDRAVALAAIRRACELDATNADYLGLAPGHRVGEIALV